MRSMSLAFPLILTLVGVAAAPVAAQTVFLFPLEESQEVPPTGSLATGACIARLNPIATELAVICAHDVVGVSAAHIHNAPAGANGGIVFPFPSATSPFRGVWFLSIADVNELLAGNLYVNVHSGAFPAGEIRGQIGAPSNMAFSFPLEEGQEVPPTGSAASGVCDAVLNNAQTELTTACFHDVVGVTAAHIHNAPAGANGGIVFPFSSPASPFLETWMLTPADVADLLANDLYVNVHSGAFPAGEIRGQMLPAAEVIFGDGFETGDFSRWASCAPPGPC